MKVPAIVERFGWGVLLSIAPFIVGGFVYTAISMLLDADGTDTQLFMYAGILGASYWALEGDWVKPDEPYSASVVVTNLAVALMAGTVTFALHLIWAIPIFDWFGWPLKWIGIPVGLAAGASIVMGGRQDIERIRYKRCEVEDTKC